MKLVMVLALLAAACSKKGGGSDCDAATSRGVDQTIAKRRGADAPPMTPEEQKVPDKLKGVLAKACVDDKWSKEVIDCFKTAEDIAMCKEKLTPEQRASYTRNVMQVMMGSRGSGGMPPHGMPGGMPGGPMTGSQPTTPPPPSGSDTPPAGSAPPPAGSGSAR